MNIGVLAYKRGQDDRFQISLMIQQQRIDYKNQKDPKPKIVLLIRLQFRYHKFDRIPIHFRFRLIKKNRFWNGFRFWFWFGF